MQKMKYRRYNGQENNGSRGREMRRQKEEKMKVACIKKRGN
jgi:hypothetical protein